MDIPKKVVVKVSVDGEVSWKSYEGRVAVIVVRPMVKQESEVGLFGGVSPADLGNMGHAIQRSFDAILEANGIAEKAARQKGGH